jgi:acyl-CoA reductase-like NAD-dependent aldehyde dehydrogenase
MLEDAESKGTAFLAAAPGYPSSSSLKPSILLGVSDKMDLYDQEAFGPSAALYIAQDNAHAIEIANDTQYGLDAAIYTTSLYRALEMAKKLETGRVHINNMTPHDERKCSLSPNPSPRKQVLFC